MYILKELKSTPFVESPVCSGCKKSHHIKLPLFRLPKEPFKNLQSDSFILLRGHHSQVPNRSIILPIANYPSETDQSTIPIRYDTIARGLQAPGPIDPPIADASQLNAEDR